jgi:hypothetical protein
MGLNTLAAKAKDARFVLVVGVEKMTERNAGQAEIEPCCSRRRIVKPRKGTSRAGFAGIFGKIASAVLPEATATSRTRWRKIAVEGTTGTA